MYIHGDIFIAPQYPMYFGVGYHRFEERVKGIMRDWYKDLDELVDRCDWLKKLANIKQEAVLSISINKENQVKDNYGNVDLPVITNDKFEIFKNNIDDSIDSLAESLHNFDFELMQQKQTVENIKSDIQRIDDVIVDKEDNIYKEIQTKYNDLLSMITGIKSTLYGSNYIEPTKTLVVKEKKI